MNKKIIILGLLITATIAIITYTTYVSVSRDNKVAVKLDIFPSTATITINGKEISRGTNYLDTGIYNIKATQDGFTDFSNTLDVNIATTAYAISLEPVSDEAKKWFDDNQKEYLRVRELSESSRLERNKYFADKNPIASKLPYKSFIYTIGYQLDASDPTENSILITIHASEGYRQSALYRIRQLGYDPTDLNIIFRDYENPFPL